MPRVSIILTSFNHAKYLREAIDSTLAQTFSDFELIIWDDASSDNSWEIIQGYDDPRIRAFRNNQQRRTAYGINKAISELALGEYIAIHHSDDIWESCKLEKQVAFLDSHSAIGAVFSNTFIIDEEGDPFTDKTHFYYKIFDQPNRNRHEWLRFFFEKGNALCHPSVLIRKQCYADCGLYRYGFAQLTDFDMWVRLAQYHEIHVLPDKLVRFRVRANESNASGSRVETRSRGLYEYSLIFNHYLQIKTADELIKIFPEAEKFFSHEIFNPHYVLAMVTLDIRPFHFSTQFALNILHQLLNDPGQADHIGLNSNDFIRFTGELDPMHVRQVEELHQAITERDRQITMLDRTITERDRQITMLDQAMTERDEKITAYQQSYSWRITQPLRFLATYFQWSKSSPD